MKSPGQKVHRINRRKLGRGQFAAASPVTFTVSGNGAVASIFFSSPVVVKGRINFAVVTLSQLSQAIISSTQIDITFNGNVAGHAYEMPSPPANVLAQTGGAVLGGTGTF